MINALLILVLATVTALQSREAEARAAIVYTAPVVAYPLFSDMLGDVAYYMIAAALSTISAILLLKCKAPTRFRRDLAMLCGGSVAFNLVGWLLYDAGFPPTVYNVLFTFLYLTAIWVLTGGTGHARRTRRSRNRRSLHSYAFADHQYRRGIKWKG